MNKQEIINAIVSLESSWCPNLVKFFKVTKLRENKDHYIANVTSWEEGEPKTLYRNCVYTKSSVMGVYK